MVPYSNVFAFHERLPSPVINRLQEVQNSQPLPLELAMFTLEINLINDPETLMTSELGIQEYRLQQH